MQDSIQNITDPDEIVIDIGKYITHLARSWRLILAFAIIAALLASLVSIALPAPYQAVASVAIVRSSTSVEFDPKIKTVSQDELAAAQPSTDNRRNTLVSLVLNADIAQRVLQRLQTQPGLLTDRETQPSVLMEKVTGEIAARNELIQISVKDRDPVKAALIANAWAEEYERLVNILYVGASPVLAESVAKEYALAQQSAGEAQTSLETFIASSDEDALKRTIEERRQVLDALKFGRQSALTLVISETLRVNSGIISAYLNAQSANRLIAFEKEQQGQRELIGALLDARNAANVVTVRSQLEANIELLHRLQATRVQTLLYLDSARAMHESLRSGGDAAAHSNQTALSLLKTNAFALSAPVSNTSSVQLQMAPDASPVSAEAMMGDVDGLIAAFQLQLKSVSQEIAILSESLQDGSVFNLGKPEGATVNRLSEAIKQTYPSLFDVSDIGQLSERVPVTNPLTLAAQRRANEAIQLQSNALGLDTKDDNSQGGIISALQSEISRAEAQLENQKSRKLVLTNNRDLKRATEETLSKKLAEVNLSKTLPGSEVRLAGPAIAPARRSQSAAVPVALAGLGGLLIAIIAALLIHGAPGLALRNRWIGGTTRSARLSRWLSGV